LIWDCKIRQKLFIRKLPEKNI